MARVIRNYFTTICSGNFNQKQTDFLNFIWNNLKDVKMSDYDINLNAIGIKSEVLRQFDLKPKQCYSNAANVCIYGNSLNNQQATYEIKYCEGYVTTLGGWLLNMLGIVLLTDFQVNGFTSILPSNMYLIIILMK